MPNPFLRDQVGLAGAVLLIAAPALLPYHADPLPTFYQDWLAFAFGLLAALPVLLARHGESVRVPPVALGLLGLVLVLAMQVLLARATFIESSVTGMLAVAWAALTVIAGAHLAQRFGLERACTAIQIAFAAGGFLLAVTGLVQFWSVEVAGFAIIAPRGSDIFGALGQRNYFSNLVACGLASLLALAARRRLAWPNVLLAGAPMILALALSASRVTWLFVAVMLACAAVRRERRLFAITAAAALLLALLTLAHAAGWIYNPGGNTVTGAARLIEMLMGSAVKDGRAALAAGAWQVFLAYPLLGAGWGELAWNVFTLAPELAPMPPGLIDKHCHNLALQLLAETGFAGALCVLVPLAAWFVPSSGAVKQEDGPARTWLITIAAMQAAQAMLELPHWYAYLLGPFALVLGLGSCTAVRFTLRGAWLYAPRLLLVAAIPLLGARIADYSELETWTTEALAAQRAGVPLPPEMFRRLERLDATVFAPQVQLIAAQLQGHTATGDIEARLALNGRAMHVFPLPSLALDRAALLIEAGRLEEADAVLRSTRAVWGRAAVPTP